MLVVLDTNVIYQALRSYDGASNYILQLVRNNKINIALSISAFSEYEDVLNRKKTLLDLGLTKTDIEKFLRFIAYKGKPFNIYFKFRPNLPDEKDNLFIELAVTSNSHFLITNNVNDFKQGELKFDDLNIMTPSQFVKYWRKNYEKKC